MQEEIKLLIARKDQMEAELASLETQIKLLNQANQLDKGVVDQQGFPRADVNFGDLANYRNLKRRKAEINNDHTALMKQIELRLFDLHKNLPDVQGEQQVFSSKQKQESQPKTLPQSKHEMKQEKPHNIDYITPFGKISFVNPGSPAQKAGVKEGDLVSEFSQVTIYTIDYMKEIPKYVRQGQPLKLVVLRPLGEKKSKGENIFELKDGKLYEKLTIEVIPAIWAGKGIFGCKIDPLH